MDKNEMKSIALTLSGGGSRAIAFHLGCFRALKKLALLDHVKVISSVSGGSVINAMYSYEDREFDHFEKRVLELLRRGIQKDGIYHWLLTGRNRHP
jgi:NTE family protein